MSSLSVFCFLYVPFMPQLMHVFIFWSASGNNDRFDAFFLKKMWQFVLTLALSYAGQIICIYREKNDTSEIDMVSEKYIPCLTIDIFETNIYV